MSPALVISGYAAVVSTISLVWQVFLWRERRRTRVAVGLRLFEVAVAGGEEQRVGVRAFNHSENAVRLTGAELEPQDGSGSRFFIARAPENPVISAHDSLDTWVARRALEEAGLDLSKPIVAIVRVADGGAFRSRPLVLAPEQSGQPLPRPST